MKPKMYIPFAIVLLLAITSVIAQSAATSYVSFVNIDNPGAPRVHDRSATDDIDIEDSDSGEVYIPVADAASLAAQEARERNAMLRKYPQLCLVNIALPAYDRALTSVVSNLTDRLREGHVYLEAELNFVGGIKAIYCVQLVPIIGDTPELDIENTTQEISSYLNINAAISATPDPDGKLRFDITELVPKLRSGELDGRFALKPFKYADRFEMPDSRTVPFRIVRAE